MSRSPRARRVARWIPVILLVGGVGFDLITPPGYVASPFFAAAPLVASSLYSLRGTAVTAAASTVAPLVLALFQGVSNRTQAATEIVTVLTVGLLAIAINRVVRIGDRRLADARSIAEAVQRAVLPEPPARTGGLEIAARYVAAQAGAAIGGDLYAVQDTPHGVRLIIGDVRGKGVGAVETVAVIIGAFREAAEQETTLEGLAVRLERSLQREAARRAGLEQDEGFTTAVLAEVPRGACSTLRLINRGHPAPLLLCANGDVHAAEPDTAALPLGMAELGAWPDRVEEQPFAEGSMLLLFTDGVTEARDPRGTFYDPLERLRGRIFAGPESVLEALVADVARHTGGGPADDMAILAVRRPPPPPATGGPDAERSRS